jgi:hypothetical protein
MIQVASGVSGASPIWRRIVLAAVYGKPNIKFPVPSGIVTADVDVVSGFRAHDGWPYRQESFIKGTEPSDDTVHTKLKVCKSDGKLASPSDIAANNYDEKEYYVFKEEDPTATSGGPNKWQEGILNWLSTKTEDIYHPPSDYCGTANPLNVEFLTPTDHNSNLDNSFTVKVKADSTSDISQVDLEIDGTKVKTWDGLPYEYAVTSLGDGVHKLRAIARDSKGNQSDRIITIGVHKNWDWTAGPGYTPNP